MSEDAAVSSRQRLAASGSPRTLPRDLDVPAEALEGQAGLLVARDGDARMSRADGVGDGAWHGGGVGVFGQSAGSGNVGEVVTDRIPVSRER